MASLRTLLKKLMVEGEVEPAGWLGNAGRKGKPPAFSKLGIAAAPELAQYVALAEEPAFRKSVAGVVQRDGAFYWGIVPVREPASLLFTLTASEVVAFLMGSSVLGSDPDSGAYLTASWADAEVASFLFNDVSPADAKPGDFVVEASSISDWLTRYGSRRRPKTNKELARLYRRGIWIAQLVQEDDLDDVDDMKRTVADASPLKLYANERETFAKRPHFAAYWLLAHALSGRTEPLADALARTEKSKHPTIARLRKDLAPVAKNPDALFRLFAKKRSKKDLETIRHWSTK